MLSQPDKEQPNETKYKITQSIPEDTFNKITYIQYDFPASLISPEIDYLLDYSKILNTKYNDTKLLNWQNSNLESLKGTGINEKILLKRAEIKQKEKNSLSYYDNTIQNLNYRLERHGKLAPSEEIIKKSKKLKNSPGKILNPEKKNENYYDGEDDFIDDTLDKSNEEEQNLIFMITLTPGNYTEQEIIDNLNKNENKFSNINNSNIYNDLKSKSDGSPKNRNIKFLSQKTERDGIKTEKKLNRNKLFNHAELNDLSYEKINYLIDKLIKKYDAKINTEYEIGNFIRRNMRNIRELDDRNKNEVRKVFADKFNINLKTINYLLDFIFFKSCMESKNGIFTKCLGNILNIINEYKNFKITGENELINLCSKNKDFHKNLDTFIKTIVEYRKEFNNYIGAHYQDLSEINRELKIFIKDIEEKNKEYIMRLSVKLEESLKKNNIELQICDLIKLIKNQYSDISFGEDLSDDNKRIYSLETFLDSNLGKKIKLFKEQNAKTTKIKKENTNDSNKISQNFTPSKLKTKINTSTQENCKNNKVKATLSNVDLNIKKINK